MDLYHLDNVHNKTTFSHFLHFVLDEVTTRTYLDLESETLNTLIITWAPYWGIWRMQIEYGYNISETYAAPRDLRPIVTCS